MLAASQAHEEGGGNGDCEGCVLNTYLWSFVDWEQSALWVLMGGRVFLLSKGADSGAEGPWISRLPLLSGSTHQDSTFESLLKEAQSLAQCRIHMIELWAEARVRGSSRRPRCQYVFAVAQPYFIFLINLYSLSSKRWFIIISGILQTSIIFSLVNGCAAYFIEKN